MVVELDAPALQEIHQRSDRLAAVARGGTYGRDKLAQGVTRTVEFAVRIEAFLVHKSFDHHGGAAFKNFKRPFYLSDDGR